MVQTIESDLVWIVNRPLLNLAFPKAPLFISSLYSIVIWAIEMKGPLLVRFRIAAGLADAGCRTAPDNMGARPRSAFRKECHCSGRRGANSIT
ncbi:hypothetical protein CEXT_96401 [Caerostris extrusa]|uniref:Uncharacterized protein n=1 Tax=Caerostris extrusa TaxID=172846 RepID=A0AAV4VS40_CAEEX|nr:hypothetical protein CEXT_96401 [Caerostris extrusa]